MVKVILIVIICLIGFTAGNPKEDEIINKSAIVYSFEEKLDLLDFKANELRNKLETKLHNHEILYPTSDSLHD